MRDWKNFLVFCAEDGCDWKKELMPEAVYGLLNKPCPKCGRGRIVQESDIADMERIMRGEEAS